MYSGTKSNGRFLECLCIHSFTCWHVIETVGKCDLLFLVPLFQNTINLTLQIQEHAVSRSLDNFRSTSGQSGICATLILVDFFVVRVPIHLYGQTAAAPKGAATIPPTVISAAFGRNHILFAIFHVCQRNGDGHPNRDENLYCELHCCST